MKKILVLLILFISLLIPILFHRPKTQANVCENMSWPKLRKICYASLSGDLKICEKFDGLYLRVCGEAVLSNKKINASFCRKISNKVIKNICLRKVVKTSKDPKLCEDPYCYFSCMTVDCCNRIDVSFLKYTCLAKTTKDLKNCELIEDEHEGLACKSIFSTEMNECMDSYGELVPACVITVAKNSNRVDGCLRMGTEYLRAKCVALASNEIEKCGMLEGWEKELCEVMFLGKDLEVVYE